MLQSWANLLLNSLQQVWGQFAVFLADLVEAIIVFIILLVVAAVVGWLVEKAIDTVKLDSLLRHAGVEEYLERAGIRLHSGKFLGGLVYWFVVIVALLAVTNIMQVPGFSEFLQQVVDYIPLLIVAIFILLIAVVIANFLRKVVHGSIISAKLHSANLLAGMTWWTIFLVGLVAALQELRVGDVIASYLGYVLQGVVLMVSLAVGLAFGLGGKEYAAHLIERFRNLAEK
ncbi:MAG: hypothetical protein M1361_01370 [Patescibacteria group bacterium]|nr:hypothetical protein [Patescibacteria group bacterium]MCL5224249.1 hypothetical protein [Patescibacteria group bacterium]